MEKKNSCARAGFSTILWGVLAVLLCAAPCGATSEEVPAGVEKDIDYTISGSLTVWGTANLLPPDPGVTTGAIIEWWLYAKPDSHVNVKWAQVTYWIDVSLNANVTVYGTEFWVGPEQHYAGEELFITLNSGPLTVVYENGQQVDLEIDCFGEIGGDYATINLAAPGGGPQPVEIDIKPGSDPNPINPGSNGLVPVAILTTDDFSAADVDPATVTLAGAEVAVRGKAEKLMARLEDVDGDGDDDLLLQVETQSEGALWTSGPVTLNGTTYGGQPIEGQDDVIIVPEG